MSELDKPDYHWGRAVGGPNLDLVFVRDASYHSREPRTNAKVAYHWGRLDEERGLVAACSKNILLAHGWWDHGMNPRSVPELMQCKSTGCAIKWAEVAIDTSIP